MSLEYNVKIKINFLVSITARNSLYQLPYISNAHDVGAGTADASNFFDVENQFV